MATFFYFVRINHRYLFKFSLVRHEEIIQWSMRIEVVASPNSLGVQEYFRSFVSHDPLDHWNALLSNCFS